MAAHEHHPQAVIGNFLFGENRRVRGGTGPIHETDDFNFLVTEHLFALNGIQCEVSRNPHDPGGGIFRDAENG
jgi:hypothetical protein